MDLQEINKQLKEINKSINLLYDRQRLFEKNRDEIKQRMLQDDSSILQEDYWTLKCSDNFKLYLDDNNRDGFKKLRNLYETNYHVGHDIFDDYSLIFNDGDMCLQAKTNEQLLNFIKVHKLKIKNTLQDRINTIDSKISELHAVKNTIMFLNNQINGENTEKS